jgi:two-component system response regulator AtoC
MEVTRMNKKILIVDDEKTIRMSMKEGLSDLGYQVSTAQSSSSALEKVREFKPQVVFLDMRLAEENGLDILPRIKEIDHDVEVVIMTAYGDIQTAVKAIKEGAFDYINKPFDLQEINIIIERVITKIDLQNKIYLLENAKKTKINNIYGEHPTIKEIHNKIDILSNNDDVTVLVTGETGTGKELVASAIHENSPRKDAPMLKINCGTIPQQLIESELFGFEKSAFTGANKRKKGLMEIADGSTVFLDEIGEFPLAVQPKLLRFIEEKKFKRVGGLVDISVDIRIIAATNKNLEEAIKNKEFREDLYYRLNVVPINLPPLRERGKDILLLADYYLKVFNEKFHKCIKGFTKDAKKSLANYSWKGNVRELKNVIERIVILCEVDYIDSMDLPFGSNYREISEVYEKPKELNREVTIKDFHPDFSLEEEVKKLETKYIKLALEYCDYNYSSTSEMLGISRFALKRRIEKYL